MRTRGAHRKAVHDFRRKRAAACIQRILVRDIDHITLRPKKKPFLLRRGRGVVSLDAEPLFDFILRSGDTRDPLAREELTHEELRQLEARVGRLFPPLHSLRAEREEDLHRRQLIELLTDEVLSHRSFDALGNLHHVATLDELRGVYSLLRLSGIRPPLQMQEDLEWRELNDFFVPAPDDPRTPFWPP